MQVYTNNNGSLMHTNLSDILTVVKIEGEAHWLFGWSKQVGETIDILTSVILLRCQYFPRKGQ